MKHDQVSERGVTSAHRTMEEEKEEEDEDEEKEGERVSLPFPTHRWYKDQDTASRRIRKVGGTNEVRARVHEREEDIENLVQEER